MRKAQKQQAEEFAKLLDRAHNEIRKAIDRKDPGTARELLEQCQEGAFLIFFILLLLSLLDLYKSLIDASCQKAFISFIKIRNIGHSYQYSVPVKLTVHNISSEDANMGTAPILLRSLLHHGQPMFTGSWHIQYAVFLTTF